MIWPARRLSQPSGLPTTRLLASGTSKIRGLAGGVTEQQGAKDVRVAIGTGILFALVVVFGLLALVFYDPECKGFRYEFEFKTTQC